MPDPAELLAAEGLETPLPATAGAPGASDASLAPPEQPARSQGPADASAAADPAPAQPGGLRASLRNIWRRLRAPTQSKPADYAERRLTRICNGVVDGRGRLGIAARVQLGESVSLVLDHAIAGGRGEAQTPLGHLVGSVGEYIWVSWDEATTPPPEGEPREERA